MGGYAAQVSGEAAEGRAEGHGAQRMNQPQGRACAVSPYGPSAKTHLARAVKAADEVDARAQLHLQRLVAPDVAHCHARDDARLWES